MPHDVVAIVPAAGLGRRFGHDRNKPFETLGGKPVIVWALEALEHMGEVREIIPVLKESDIRTGIELFSRYRITKIRSVAPGGRERQDSVFNALHFIKEKPPVILIHDGVRPFFDTRVVKKALQALADCDGVVIGVPPKDTIKEMEGGIIKQTLKRDTLISIQTPQLFRYQPLLNAYERAMQEAFYATDDSALVEWNGGRIRVIIGGYTNIKVTTPEDLVIAEAFLKKRGDGQ
jgi:2-C-methyl-D-erythritol 4-phosphate cytidylyltransferase